MLKSFSKRFSDHSKEFAQESLQNAEFTRAKFLLLISLTPFLRALCGKDMFLVFIQILWDAFLFLILRLNITKITHCQHRHKILKTQRD